MKLIMLAILLLFLIAVGISAWFMERANLAIFISILALITSIFGAAKGIKELFFSNPKIEIEAFMPVVVWDDGFNLESKYPSFLFGGLVKIRNPDNFDVSISEMRIYGISRDTSGRDASVLTSLGQPNYTHIYKLDITGLIYKNSIIKSYKSDFLQFKIAYFNTDMEPTFKMLPYKSSHSDEYGQPIEYVIVPMYNNLFKFNDKHSPEYLVDEILKGELIFAIYFNGNLIKIPPKSILPIFHCDKSIWEDTSKISKAYSFRIAEERAGMRRPELPYEKPNPSEMIVLSEVVGRGIFGDSHRAAIIDIYRGSFNDITGGQHYGQDQECPYYGRMVKVVAESQVTNKIISDRRFFVVAMNRGELNAVPNDEWFRHLQGWLVQRGMPLDDANVFIKKINKLTRNEIIEQLLVLLQIPKPH